MQPENVCYLVYFALCFKNKTNWISCQHVNCADCIPESSLSWKLSPGIPGLTSVHYGDSLGWWKLPPGGSPGRASIVPAVHPCFGLGQPTHSLVGIWIFDLSGRNFVRVRSITNIEVNNWNFKNIGGGTEHFIHKFSKYRILKLHAFPN